MSIQIRAGGDVRPWCIPCKVDKTFAFHPRAAIDQGLCRRLNVKCRSILDRGMNGDMAAEVSPPINRTAQGKIDRHLRTAPAIADYLDRLVGFLSVVTVAGNFE